MILRNVKVSPKQYYENVSWQRESVQKGLNAFSGAQFASLLLVMPVACFVQAVIKWCSRSVVKSAYYWWSTCIMHMERLRGIEQEKNV